MSRPPSPEPDEAELCARMLGLAYHVADRCRGPLDRDDARGVAALALVRSIRSHDPARGPLDGYVARAVRYEVRNARDQHGPIDVPRHAMRAWRAAAAGKPVPGMPAKSQARYAADAGRALAATSLDAPRGAGCPVGDFLAARGLSDAGPEDLDALRRAIDALPDVERATIVARFGLDGEPPRQLPEIAAAAGRTKQAIHCREKRALGRLRVSLEESPCAGRSSLRRP